MRSSCSQGVDVSTLLGLLPVQTGSNPAMLCYTRTTDFPEKEQAEVKVDLRGAACKTLQLVSPTANSKMSCGNIRSSSQIPSMSIYSLWLLTSGMVSSGSKPSTRNIHPRSQVVARDVKPLSRLSVSLAAHLMSPGFSQCLFCIVPAVQLFLVLRGLGCISSDRQVVRR